MLRLWKLVCVCIGVCIFNVCDICLRERESKRERSTSFIHETQVEAESKKLAERKKNLKNLIKNCY